MSENIETRMLELCEQHYRETFRPAQSVRLGIRGWVELLRLCATRQRFSPTPVPHDDSYCAYCQALLPLRRPGARCGSCGAPWTEREHARNDACEKLRYQMSFGAVDVICDSSLAGDAIEVS